MKRRAFLKIKSCLTAQTNCSHKAGYNFSPRIDHFPEPGTKSHKDEPLRTFKARSKAEEKLKSTGTECM